MRLGDGIYERYLSTLSAVGRNSTACEVDIGKG